ncbi:MAG: hypothetical protein IPM39_16865 [Chloroflexi bacterium]|nr:hypothetical protein [Chloroflexota bacterium]
MNYKLQQAIQAARIGENKKAQYLLTQTLQENPEETQAWYLLSLLVPSEEKQIAYLNKVLALEPGHEKAQEKLAALTTAVSPPFPPSSADPDLEEQESGDQLPDWMDDEADVWQQTAAAPQSAVSDSLEWGVSETSAEEIPDWLQEDMGDKWAQAESETPVDADEDQLTLIEAFADAKEDAAPDLRQTPTPRPPAAAPVKKPQPVKQQQGAGLTILLALLVILAILVGAFLIYLLITM